MAKTDRTNMSGKLPTFAHCGENHLGYRHVSLQMRSTKIIHFFISLLLQSGRPGRRKLKEAFEHAWSGYRNYAMGYDELMP
jgi:hypothetical protein